MSFKLNKTRGESRTGFLLTKTEKAKAVGAELARLALEKGIKKACFDRGRCLYHGRVKALSEGISEGGLSV